MNEEPHNHSRPRWVKALAIVALVVVLLIVLLHVTGNSPGDHMHSP